MLSGTGAWVLSNGGNPLLKTLTTLTIDSLSSSLPNGLSFGCSSAGEQKNTHNNKKKVSQDNIYISGSNVDILRGNKLAVKLQYVPQLEVMYCLFLV